MTKPTAAAITCAALCIALAGGPVAAQPQTALRTPPPPPRAHNTVLCTMLDGDPYSIVVERGACELGYTQVGGGSGDAPSDPSQVVNHCSTQLTARQLICSRERNGGIRSSCFSAAASGYSMCVRSQVQPPFTYY